MKKSLVALATLAATGAFAQTSVTLYGTLDAGVASFKNVGSAGTQSMTAVTDGALSSSVWGLRGSEDLGGGLKANFNAESDISTNNGTYSSSGLFRRASNVGLSGDFGALDIGVKMNPVIATNSALMTTAGNSVSTMTSGAMNFSDFFTRNAITYTSPTVLGGLVAQVQRGMSQSVNSDSAGSVTAFSLAYVNGPLELRFANQDRKGAAAAGAVSGANPSVPAYNSVAADGSATVIAAAASGDKKTNIAGVKYALGAWTVAAATYSNSYTSTPGGAATNVKGNGLSASYKLNAQTTLGVARMSGRTTGDSSTLTHLQARYELSKRTQLYSVYGVANNAASGIKFWPYASNTNTVTGSTSSPSVAVWDAGTPGTGGVAGKNQSAVGVGVIHSF